MMDDDLVVKLRQYQSKLIETKIEDSIIYNATFQGASLLHTEIEDSSITNSNFIGAIISNVKLKSVILDANQIDESTLIEAITRIDWNLVILCNLGSQLISEHATKMNIRDRPASIVNTRFTDKNTWKF